MSRRPANQPKAHALACAVVLKQWSEDADVVRKVLAEKARISPTYLSQVLAGQKAATKDVLTRLAEGLSHTSDELEEAAKSIAAGSAFGNLPLPGLALGPFPDSLLLQFAMLGDPEWSPTVPWPAVQRGAGGAATASDDDGYRDCPMEVRPWGDDLNELARSIDDAIDNAKPMLAFTNLRRAQDFQKGTPTNLLRLFPWQIRLHPCFCLVRIRAAGTSSGDPGTSWYAKSLKEALANTKGAAKVENSHRLVLRDLLEKQLRGVVVLAEGFTDIASNARELRTWGEDNKLDITFTVQPTRSTSESLFFLGNHHLVKNRVVSGGSPQLRAAAEKSRLEVLVTDADLEKTFEIVEPGWWASNWKNAVNGIVIRKNSLPAGLLDKVAGHLDAIFAKLNQPSDDEIWRRAALWMQPVYERRYGGAGVDIGPRALTDLLAHDIRVERTADWIESARFAEFLQDKL